MDFDPNPSSGSSPNAIAPPPSQQAFEALCLELFRAAWRNPDLQLAAHMGVHPAPGGVDVLGANWAEGGGPWGALCVAADHGVALDAPGLTRALSKADMVRPELEGWVLATTVPRDAALLAHVRKLSADRAADGRSRVVLLAWEDLLQLLAAHQEVGHRFYPDSTIAAQALRNEIESVRRAKQQARAQTAAPPAFQFWEGQQETLTDAEFRTQHRTWLQSLRLAQFRCFESLDIQFDEQLTVLIAPNGGGKTALLDAVAIAFGLFIQCFYTGKGRPLNDDDVRLQCTDPDLHLMAPQFPVTIHASASIVGNPCAWAYRHEMGQTEATPANAAPVQELGTEMQRAISRNSAITLPLLACYGTNRLGDQARRGSDDYPPDFFLRTAGYKNCLDSAANFADFEKWFKFAERSAKESPPAVVAAGTAVATVSAVATVATGATVGGASEKGYRPLLAAVRAALDICLADSGWHNLHLDSRDRLAMHHPQRGTLQVRQLSDGIKNIIALVADIAQRAVRLNPQFGAAAAQKTPGVVLVDEIDLHLHPKWQQTILHSLQQAFPQLQFIITTHSAQLLSAVPPASIRILH